MKEKKEGKWAIALKKILSDEDVFWNNEIRANLFVSQMLIILIGVLIITFILNKIGIFTIPEEQMAATLLFNIPCLLAGTIISGIFKGQKHWIKYMLCIIAQLTAVSLCSIMNIFVALIVAIPVILSVRYYSKKLTIVISIITIIGMAFSEFSYGMSEFINLNLIPAAPGEYTVLEGSDLRAAVLAQGYDLQKYLINLFEGSFAPRLLLFSIIAAVCVELATRARNMVLEQQEISQKTEGIKTELSMATSIQESSLPKIFPPFPERKEFDIFAKMDPAKEVGGDFYDFFLVDNDHLALVMADVSGKGVPAALYMMISKILIKTYSCNGLPPSIIAESVNETLLGDNDVEMFVTVWMGILEISTGKIISVDAGHEYPAIKRANGKFEILKDKKSFVLGGMQGLTFKETEFQLEPGDTLFLYTDGVPEATNANDELFGIDRMISALNEEPEADAEKLLSNVRNRVDEFVKDAPQFDDLTMMALLYHG